MIQVETGFFGGSGDDTPCFFDVEEDEIFEQNIDDFDEEMDNQYDDGIADSHIEDSYDEDLTDEQTENFNEIEEAEDHPPIRETPDELDDYDELEE